MNSTLKRDPKLQHPDKNVRLTRALHIGGQRDRDGLDGLVAALRDEPDFFVRETITWALVRLGELSLVPLMALAEHESPRVRHDAVHALSKLGYDDASLVLWERLADPDHVVVAKAAYALGLMRERGAIPELVTLLEHEDPTVRTAASEALETMGGLAFEHLGAALTGGSVEVRERVAGILGSIGGPAAITVLRTGLADEHWTVRVAVLMALGLVGGSSAQAAISQAVHDSDVRVRAVADRLS